MDGHLKEEGREEGRERAGYRGFNFKSVNNLMVWVTRKNKISPSGRRPQHLCIPLFRLNQFRSQFQQKCSCRLRVRRCELEMTFNGEIIYSRAPGKTQLTWTAQELTIHHYLGKPFIIHNYEMHILHTVDISINSSISRATLQNMTQLY